MVHPALLLHLGDLALTVPLAAAIGAWLLAARGWRAAAGWTLLFGAALALVGASKIAYLGWGGGVPALHFKAVSGHATGSMAIYPVLLTLLTLLAGGAGPAWRAAAGAAGAVLALAVALLLVAHGEHTASEAAAGCVLGALVAIGGLHLAGSAPPARPLTAMTCALLVFAGGAWLMGPAPVGYWMIKAARLLSGHARPCTLANHHRNRPCDRH